MATASDLDNLILQARQHLRKRETLEAIALFEQILEVDERHIAAHEGIATSAFLLQDYGRAVKHFKRLTQLDPRRAQPYVNLGAVHNRQGEHALAIKTLRQALAKDGKCAEAYYNLGLAHRGLNQLSMAVSAYKEAIRLAPDMAEAYQNLGNVCLEMGNSQQAVLNYERALKIRPDFDRARRGLERATNAAQQSKASVGAFGRLVDATSLGGLQVSTADQFLRLTPQQRFEDRTNVHRLAKDAERAAAALLTQVRDQLHPSLSRLNHAFVQQDDRPQFQQEHRTLQESRVRYEDFVRLLTRLTTELRQHEASMRK